MNDNDEIQEVDPGRYTSPFQFWDDQAANNIDFRGIFNMINNWEAEAEIAVDELSHLGDDDPRLPSLKVDRYTIGTRFYNPTRYKNGEVYKLVLARSILRRTNIALETLEEKFKEWRLVAFPQRQRRYFENPHIHEYHRRDNFFVECLFIIEVIRRFTCGDEHDAADGLGSTALLLHARRDLIVNDNQLPFSVLEGLFNLAFPILANSHNKNFLVLSVEFFGQCMLITEYSKTLETTITKLQQDKSPESQIKNFIDLVRTCHKPLNFSRRPPEDRIKFIAMHKASYLEEAGMYIRPSALGTTVCNIHYSRGMLKIPKLKITHKSIHLLRNLTEYEIQHHPQDTFIIDYLHFMDNLIDTAKDVDVLIHNGILDNFLPNSQGVADLFNNITKEAPLITHNYYYREISEKVNAYCEIPRHRWKAVLRRDYCSSPWMAASTTAAIFLLLLTVIRTVCAIISLTQ